MKLSHPGRVEHYCLVLQKMVETVKDCNKVKRMEISVPMPEFESITKSVSISSELIDLGYGSIPKKRGRPRKSL